MSFQAPPLVSIATQLFAVSSPGLTCTQLVYVNTSSAVIHLNVPSVSASVPSRNTLVEVNCQSEKYRQITVTKIRKSPQLLVTTSKWAWDYCVVDTSRANWHYQLTPVTNKLQSLTLSQTINDLVFCFALNDDQMSAQRHTSVACVVPRHQVHFQNVARTAKHCIAMDWNTNRQKTASYWTETRTVKHCIALDWNTNEPSAEYKDVTCAIKSICKLMRPDDGL